MLLEEVQVLFELGVVFHEYFAVLLLHLVLDLLQGLDRFEIQQEVKGVDGGSQELKCLLD